MIAKDKVPSAVREHLLANEEVMGKISCNSMRGEVDFYATDKRVLGFGRAGWWVFFFGIIGLMAQKTYVGAYEYSRISSVSLKTGRMTTYLVGGIVLGGIFLVLGLWMLTIPGAQAFGVIFLIPGLLSFVMLSILKTTYYQLEIHDLPENDLARWTMIRPRLGARRKSIKEFVETVEKKLKLP